MGHFHRNKYVIWTYPIQFTCVNHSPKCSHLAGGRFSPCLSFRRQVGSICIDRIWLLLMESGFLLNILQCWHKIHYEMNFHMQSISFTSLTTWQIPAACRQCSLMWSVVDFCNRTQLIKPEGWLRVIFWIGPDIANWSFSSHTWVWKCRIWPVLFGVGIPRHLWGVT